MHFGQSLLSQLIEIFKVSPGLAYNLQTPRTCVNHFFHSDQTIYPHFLCSIFFIIYPAYFFDESKVDLQ